MLSNDKILYKIIFTIIHTINFTNSWLINHVVLLLLAIEHVMIYHWEKVIKIIYAKIILSGQEVGKLSPFMSFIIDELRRSAQSLLSNMYDIRSFLSKKNTVDV